MKSFYHHLLILFFFYSFADHFSPVFAQSWMRIEEVDSADVYSVIRHQDYIFAITHNQIYRSINGYNEWTPTESRPDTTFSFSTLFSYNDYIYLGTLGNGIFSSVNGGKTWQNYSIGLSGYAKHITSITGFGDSLFVGTNGAGILYTNLYNPVQWQPFNEGLFLTGVNSIAISGKNLVASIGYNFFIRAAGSSHWQDIYPDTTNYALRVNEALIFDEYLFIGTATGIYRGDLNGQNWQKTDIRQFPNASIFALTRKDSLVIAGLNYRNQHWIFSTGNMGANWDIMAHEFTWLWDLYAGDNFLLAGRTDGLWYVNINEWTDIETENVNIVDGINLYQNYPNPFNPVTVISWQLAVSSHVELNIYNVIGQKVVTLVNKNQTPGNYQVQWDALDFPSGFYFYRIQAEDFVQTKRMLLIK
jgi:hypothetical protein